MATEDKNNAMSKRLLDKTRTIYFKNKIYSDDCYEMRIQAERKITALDKKIESHVNELMELLMPADARWHEKERVKEILSLSVYLDVYKRQLYTYYKSMNQQATLENPLEFYGDVAMAQQVLVSKRPTELKLQIPEKSKFKRRYTRNPISPDLKYLKDNKVVQDEYRRTTQSLSPTMLRDLVKTYPHLNTVIALRDHFYNGGNANQVVIPKKISASIRNQIDVLRKMLVEKTVIADNDLGDLIEFKNLSCFNAQEYQDVFMRFAYASENIRKILKRAELNLNNRQKFLYIESANKQFKTFAELNSGILSSISDDPKVIDKLVRDMIQNSGIDLTAINVIEMHNFKEQAKKHILTILEQNHHTQQKRVEKSESELRIEKAQKEREENQKRIIAIIAGTIGILAFQLLAAYSSKEGQELWNKGDATKELEARLLNETKIVESVGSTNSSVTDNVLNVELTNENGATYTVSLDIPSAEKVIEEEIEKNNEATKDLLNMEEDFSQDIYYDTKHGSREISDSKDSTSYVGKHIKREEISDSENTVSLNRRRIRRSDRYKNDYGEIG